MSKGRGPTTGGLGHGSGVTQRGENGQPGMPACDGLPREMLESGLPEHVFDRMDFLWRASHNLRLSSPALSRVYSDQLRKLSAEQESGVGVLPEWISDTLCSACGGVLTPGVTCRVRVRHRSLRSPAAKKASATKGLKRCRNELVMSCLLCGGVNAKQGTLRSVHHRKRRKSKNTGDELNAAETIAQGNQAAGRTRVANNLRGNFIPLGASSSTRPSAPRQASVSTPKSEKSSSSSSINKKGKGKAKSNGGVGNVVSSNDLMVAGGSVGRRTTAASSERSSGGRRGSEPPSLLDTIKKKARRKRRDEAAAAATAAAAASEAGEQGTRS